MIFKLCFCCLFGLLSLGAGALRGEETINSIGMKLEHIQPGSFIMGQEGPASDYRMVKHPAKFDDADWDERPAHKVTISQGFFIGAEEVTLGQYRRFKPSFRPGKGNDDDAANGITWEQAVAFCEWLSKKEGETYRLPTEAEWEYACRAGTTTLFNTGDALPDGFQPWFGDLAALDRFFPKGELPPPYRKGGRTNIRVAQTAPNAWGLHDMHGNVAEWCADWYGPYEAGDQTDPLGRSEGDFRVIRGGSHSAFARLLRSANRAAWLPQTASEKTGFRVVRAAWPKGRPLPPPLPPLNARNVSQSLAKIKATPADVPVFEGPRPYVKIPPDSVGPLFATHNHSPSLTECPNGDLLAVWYSCADEGGPELCNLASRLRRGSQEWEPASPFWDGMDVNDHAPKVWWDGDKTLYHFARGLEENIMRTSTDNGATWSRASLILPVGEFGNRVLRLKDGTLVLGNDARQVSLVWSRDNGRTWAFNEVTKGEGDFRPGGQGPRYPGIHAPMVQLADGRIMLVSRNDKPEDQAKFGFKTPASFTGDLGKTWTYEATPFPAISSVQRATMIRLHEGPILLVSFTDQWRDWKNRRGMSFKSGTGFGMFAALSFDEGKTWPVRRLVTPGGASRMVNGIDKVEFEMSETMAEPCGYLAATQARDGRIHLITSKNHYVFNLAWLKANEGADPHLEIAAEFKEKKVAPIVQPSFKENVTVFNEPGRYGGWPANHGLWQWGDELVAGFEVAWFKHPVNDHAVDRGKPFEVWQARSLDGGKTWKNETDLPFREIGHEKTPAPLAAPLDFTGRDFALMFRFGGLHDGPSWFYVSNDRCRHWAGPYSFAVPGLEKICTRTDLIVLGPRDCLMFGSVAKKADGKEGRVFCARTTDGGLNWKLVSLVGPEPEKGYAIMPSTVRLPGGALVTTIRNGGGPLNTITAWRSDDLGGHWSALGDATPDIGSNPPALVVLKDGRLCLSYGVRRKSFGARARISADEGRTWGPEIMLRDDGLTGDLGYPRALVRPDGTVLTVYYFNGPRDEDRTIQATFWRP